MMTEELKNKLITFYQECEKFYGFKIEISEAISTNSLNFDRHFTTFSNTEFILTRFNWRISGGRIMFESEKLNYEIASDRITKFTEFEQNEFEFIEMYSETVFRKTTIKIYTNNILDL